MLHEFLKERKIMDKFRPLIWVFFFGSVWGLSETVGGGALYSADIPMASVWLSVWALAILSLARAQQNTPGTSSAIGGVASLFRLINAGPFICHLLAIFMLGVAFDLAASFLLKQEKTSLIKGASTGILSAYGGYTLFALTITYIIRYDIWVSGGWPKVADHIFVSGSFVAASACFFVPLAFWFGHKQKTSLVFRSRLASSSALALVLLIWILGRLAG
jgi:hypothetical protein